MRIAVNAGSFTSHRGDNNQDLFSRLLLPLAISQPAVTFIFFFDTPPSEKIKFPRNAVIAIFGPNANTPIKHRIRYQVKIPLALKKHKADIFITVNYCSLKTNIPQILVSPDLSYIDVPSLVNSKHLSFYKKYTPLFLQKSSAIIVQSFFLKNQLEDRFKTDSRKINLIGVEPGNDFVPLKFDEKELIKERYADGNEYFLYKGFIGQQQNLLNLIKAFSAFKKRQKSGMQLILAGTPGVGYEELLASLKGFRFKSELKIFAELTNAEMAKITAAAYTMMYVPLFETSCVVPCEAMKSGVPLIVSSTGALPQCCGDAALYADPANFKNIAENMMQLFKDEKLRSELIEKANARSEAFCVKQDFNSLFQLMMQIAGQ